MSSPRKSKQDSDSLVIPKMPNMNLLLPIMFVPLIFAVLCGLQADSVYNNDGNGDIWVILLLVFIVLQVAGFITFLVLGLSNKKKIKQSALRASDLLKTNYGVTVTTPEVLVTHKNSGKPILNPKEIAAIGPDFKEIIISIRTDETGTKVIPTLHPRPEENEPAT